MHKIKIQIQLAKALSFLRKCRTYRVVPKKNENHCCVL